MEYLKKKLNEEVCKRCGGRGYIEFQPTSVPRTEKIICPECKGTGKILKIKAAKKPFFY